MTAFVKHLGGDDYLDFLRARLNAFFAKDGAVKGVLGGTRFDIFTVGYKTIVTCYLC